MSGLTEYAKKHMTNLRNQFRNVQSQKRTQEAELWLEEVLGKPRGSFHPLDEKLKDGVLLCQLLKRVRPSFEAPIKEGGGRLSMQAVDNLNHFLREIKTMGVRYDFEVLDLLEGKNMTKVVDCLHDFARVAFENGATPPLKPLAELAPSFIAEEEQPQAQQQMTAPAMPPLRPPRMPNQRRRVPPSSASKKEAPPRPPRTKRTTATPTAPVDEQQKQKEKDEEEKGKEKEEEPEHQQETKVIPHPPSRSGRPALSKDGEELEEEAEEVEAEPEQVEDDYYEWDEGDYWEGEEQEGSPLLPLSLHEHKNEEKDEDYEPQPARSEPFLKPIPSVKLPTCLERALAAATTAKGRPKMWTVAACAAVALITLSVLLTFVIVSWKMNLPSSNDMTEQERYALSLANAVDVNGCLSLDASTLLSSKVPALFQKSFNTSSLLLCGVTIQLTPRGYAQAIGEMTTLFPTVTTQQQSNEEKGIEAKANFSVQATFRYWNKTNVDVLMEVKPPSSWSFAKDMPSVAMTRLSDLTMLEPFFVFTSRQLSYNLTFDWLHDHLLEAASPTAVQLDAGLNFFSKLLLTNNVGEYAALKTFIPALATRGTSLFTHGMATFRGIDLIASLPDTKVSPVLTLKSWGLDFSSTLRHPFANFVLSGRAEIQPLANTFYTLSFKEGTLKPTVFALQAESDDDNEWGFDLGKAHVPVTTTRLSMTWKLKDKPSPLVPPTPQSDTLLSIHEISAARSADWDLIVAINGRLALTKTVKADFGLSTVRADPTQQCMELSGTLYHPPASLSIATILEGAVSQDELDSLPVDPGVRKAALDSALETGDGFPTAFVIRPYCASAPLLSLSAALPKGADVFDYSELLLSLSTLYSPFPVLDRITDALVEEDEIAFKVGNNVLRINAFKFMKSLTDALSSISDDRLPWFPLIVTNDTIRKPLFGATFGHEVDSMANIIGQLPDAPLIEFPSGESQVSLELSQVFAALRAYLLSNKATLLGSKPTSGVPSFSLGVTPLLPTWNLGRVPGIPNAFSAIASNRLLLLLASKPVFAHFDSDVSMMVNQQRSPRYVGHGLSLVTTLDFQKPQPMNVVRLFSSSTTAEELDVVAHIKADHTEDIKLTATFADTTTLNQFFVLSPRSVLEIGTARAGSELTFTLKGILRVAVQGMSDLYFTVQGPVDASSVSLSGPMTSIWHSAVGQATLDMKALNTTTVSLVFAASTRTSTATINGVAQLSTDADRAFDFSTSIPSQATSWNPDLDAFLPSPVCLPVYLAPRSAKQAPWSLETLTDELLGPGTIVLDPTTSIFHELQQNIYESPLKFNTSNGQGFTVFPNCQHITLFAGLQSDLLGGSGKNDSSILIQYGKFQTCSQYLHKLKAKLQLLGLRFAAVVDGTSSVTVDHLFGELKAALEEGNISCNIATSRGSVTASLLQMNSTLSNLLKISISEELYDRLEHLSSLLLHLVQRQLSPSELTFLNENMTPVKGEGVWHVQAMTRPAEDWHIESILGKQRASALLQSRRRRAAPAETLPTSYSAFVFSSIGDSAYFPLPNLNRPPSPEDALEPLKTFLFSSVSVPQGLSLFSKLKLDGMEELKTLNAMMQPYDWTPTQKKNAPPFELILSARMTGELDLDVDYNEEIGLNGNISLVGYRLHIKGESLEQYSLQSKLRADFESLQSLVFLVNGPISPIEINLMGALENPVTVHVGQNGWALISSTSGSIATAKWTMFGTFLESCALRATALVDKMVPATLDLDMVAPSHVNCRDSVDKCLIFRGTIKDSDLLTLHHLAAQTVDANTLADIQAELHPSYSSAVLQSTFSGVTFEIAPLLERLVLNSTVAGKNAVYGLQALQQVVVQRNMDLTTILEQMADMLPRASVFINPTQPLPFPTAFRLLREKLQQYVDKPLPPKPEEVLMHPHQQDVYRRWKARRLAAKQRKESAGWSFHDEEADFEPQRLRPVMPRVRLPAGQLTTSFGDMFQLVWQLMNTTFPGVQINQTLDDNNTVIHELHAPGSRELIYYKNTSITMDLLLQQMNKVISASKTSYYGLTPPLFGRWDLVQQVIPLSASWSLAGLPVIKDTKHFPQLQTSNHAFLFCTADRVHSFTPLGNNTATNKRTSMVILEGSEAAQQLPSFAGHARRGLNLFSNLRVNNLKELSAFQNLLDLNSIEKLQFQIMFLREALQLNATVAPFRTLTLSDDLQLSNVLLNMRLPPPQAQPAFVPFATMALGFGSEAELRRDVEYELPSSPILGGRILYHSNGSFPAAGDSMQMNGCVDVSRDNDPRYLSPLRAAKLRGAVVPIGGKGMPISSSCLNLTWSLEKQKKNAVPLLDCQGHLAFLMQRYEVSTSITCSDPDGNGSKNSARRVSITGKQTGVNSCAINNGGCDPATTICVEKSFRNDTILNLVAGKPPSNVQCMPLSPCSIDNGGCGDPLFVACDDNGKDKVQCKPRDVCQALPSYCGDSREWACIPSNDERHPWPSCVGLRELYLSFNLHVNSTGDSSSSEEDASGNSDSEDTILLLADDASCDDFDKKVFLTRVSSYLSLKGALDKSIQASIALKADCSRVDVTFSALKPGIGNTAGPFSRAHNTLTTTTTEHFSAVVGYVLDSFEWYFTPKDFCGDNNGNCGAYSFCANNFVNGSTTNRSCGFINTCLFDNGGCGDGRYFQCYSNNGASATCLPKYPTFTPSYIDQSTMQQGTFSGVPIPSTLFAPLSNATVKSFDVRLFTEGPFLWMSGNASVNFDSSSSAALYKSDDDDDDDDGLLVPFVLLVGPSNNTDSSNNTDEQQKQDTPPAMPHNINITLLTNVQALLKQQQQQQQDGTPASNITTPGNPLIWGMAYGVHLGERWRSLKDFEPMLPLQLSDGKLYVTSIHEQDTLLRFGVRSKNVSFDAGTRVEKGLHFEGQLLLSSSDSVPPVIAQLNQWTNIDAVPFSSNINSLGNYTLKAEFVYGVRNGSGDAVSEGLAFHDIHKGISFSPFQLDIQVLGKDQQGKIASYAVASAVRTQFSDLPGDIVLSHGVINLAAATSSAAPIALSYDNSDAPSWKNVYGTKGVQLVDIDVVFNSSNARPSAANTWSMGVDGTVQIQHYTGEGQLVLDPVDPTTKSVLVGRMPTLSLDMVVHYCLNGSHGLDLSSDNFTAVHLNNTVNTTVLFNVDLSVSQSPMILSGHSYKQGFFLNASSLNFFNQTGGKAMLKVAEMEGLQMNMTFSEMRFADLVSLKGHSSNIELTMNLSPKPDSNWVKGEGPIQFLGREWAGAKLNFSDTGLTIRFNFDTRSKAKQTLLPMVLNSEGGSVGFNISDFRLTSKVATDALTFIKPNLPGLLQEASALSSKKKDYFRQQLDKETTTLQQLYDEFVGEQNSDFTKMIQEDHFEKKVTNVTYLYVTAMFATQAVQQKEIIDRLLRDTTSYDPAVNDWWAWLRDTPQLTMEAMNSAYNLSLQAVSGAQDGMNNKTALWAQLKAALPGSPTVSLLGYDIPVYLMNPRGNGHASSLKQKIGEHTLMQQLYNHSLEESQNAFLGIAKLSQVLENTISASISKTWKIVNNTQWINRVEAAGNVNCSEFQDTKRTWVRTNHLLYKQDKHDDCVEENKRRVQEAMNQEGQNKTLSKEQLQSITDACLRSHLAEEAMQACAGGVTKAQAPGTSNITLWQVKWTGDIADQKTLYLPRDEQQGPSFVPFEVQPSVISASLVDMVRSKRRPHLFLEVVYLSQRVTIPLYIDLLQFDNASNNLCPFLYYNI
ncbi:Protein kinase of the Mitotic Exit Network [Balamuthia mandrillaris]